MRTDANTSPAALRGRRSFRVYRWIFSLSMMLVIGAVAGVFVLPAALDRHYLKQIVHTAPDDDPPQRAVAWWKRQLQSDPARLADFARTWRDQDEPGAFVQMGRVLAQAGRFDEQPAADRLRYHRHTRLADRAENERVLAVDALMRFPANTPGLAGVAADMLKDRSGRVAAQVVHVLPAWSDQDWAVDKLNQAMDDPRPEVFRKAILACGIVADDLHGSALVDLRQRLVDVLLSSADADPGEPRLAGAVGTTQAADANARGDQPAAANAAWSLLRMGWRGEPGWKNLQWFPPQVRAMAVLLPANPPIAEDRSELKAVHDALAAAFAAEADPMVRYRIGLALSAVGGGSEKLARECLSARSWPPVALGCRMVGLMQLPQFLPDLERLVLSDRPDFVSEQLAFALRRLAQLAERPDESKADPPASLRARAALRAVVDPTVIISPAKPARKVSPRTMLAAATGWAHLGELKPLLDLAGAMPPEDGELPADTLADMACLTLADLAGRDDAIARTVTEKARVLIRDYDHRRQRSGALLLAMLGDGSKSDYMHLRWQSERQAGREIVTAVYFQTAMLALGRKDVESDGPVANWLVDARMRTPGIFAMLVRGGQRAALDQLLLPDEAAVNVMMDDWRLRVHLANWMRNAPIVLQADADRARAPEAWDPELMQFNARTASWWYETHRHRLRFDAKTRTWSIPRPAATNRQTDP